MKPFCGSYSSQQKVQSPSLPVGDRGAPRACFMRFPAWVTLFQASGLSALAASSACSSFRSPFILPRRVWAPGSSAPASPAPAPGGHPACSQQNRRFSPPSERQIGSPLRAGGGQAAVFFVLAVPLQGARSSGLNPLPKAVCPRGVHIKRNLGAAREVGVGWGWAISLGSPIFTPITKCLPPANLPAPRPLDPGPGGPLCPFSRGHRPILGRVALGSTA